MSKEDWFRHFEREAAEHPEMTDEELSDRASERQADEFAARADQAKDEAKYDGPVPTHHPDVNADWHGLSETQEERRSKGLDYTPRGRG